jgi:hypothetical protein
MKPQRTCRGAAVTISPLLLLYAYVKRHECPYNIIVKANIKTTKFHIAILNIACPLSLL